MAIGKKQYQKIAMFGAIVGALTPMLLKFIVMPLLNFFGAFVPQVSLKLANPSTLVVNIRESLTGLNGAMSEWLLSATGLDLTVPFGQTLFQGALGGVVIFMIGAWVADMLGFLKGNSVAKTRTVIFTGHLVGAILLGSVTVSVAALNFDFANLLIAFMVNAALLAWLYVWIDKQLRLGLMPF